MNNNKNKNIDVQEIRVTDFDEEDHIIKDISPSYQFIFAYTDPFLLEFPELELFIWNALMDNTVGSDTDEVYLNIFLDPTEELNNVSFDRDDVELIIPNSMTYTIDKVYKENKVSECIEYIDLLNNFDGVVLSFDVIVPVGAFDDIIGEVVVLIHPSTKKQVISVCGITDLKNWLGSLE